MNPWAVAILLHFPQVAFLVYTCMGLFGSRPLWSKMLPLAVILAVALSVIRAVPALLGWHTLTFALLYIVLSNRMLGVSLLHATLAICAGYILLTVGESFIAVPVLKALNISLEDALTHTGLYVAAGWIGQTPLMIMTLLVYRYRLVIVPLTPTERKEGPK